MKDGGLHISMQRDFRDCFLCIYRAQDKPTPLVLHEFMRGYVEGYEELLADNSSRTSSELKMTAG